MAITRLAQIFEELAGRPPLGLAVAFAEDAHTLAAVRKAVDLGLVEATLTGDETRIRQLANQEGLSLEGLRILHQPADTGAAAAAVALARSGECSLLMKGSLSTDRYMRAILHRETGLVAEGGILSHVCVVEPPRHPKLLVCGDVAVIPQPDLKQKIAITNYVIRAAQALGIARPKVALIAASEQVLPGYIHTTEAAVISKMAERGQLAEAFVDGPMGLDAAIDAEAAQVKGLTGPVAGDADGLVFADIEGGNAFYKTSTKLAGAELAAMVVGAKVPCVLSSRGDSVQTKLNSIALAALAAARA
jgi:phosphate butyryltransferase